MANFAKNLLLGLLGLIAANLLLMHDLELNAGRGVYPPHADTIFIPIASSWMTSLILVVLFIPAITFRRSGSWLSLLGLVFCVLTMLLCALVSISWASPNHLSISAMYGLMTLWFGSQCFQSYSMLPTNKSRLRGAFGAGRRNRRPSLKRYRALPEAAWFGA